MKSPDMNSMLPSKISPTSSRFLLSTGEPELPPMMSLADTKSRGVPRSRPAGGRRQRAVIGISLHDAVGESQRERGVGRERRAVHVEPRAGELRREIVDPGPEPCRLLLERVQRPRDSPHEAERRIQ